MSGTGGSGGAPADSVESGGGSGGGGGGIAGASGMDAGAVGSHVWTDSSASVELRYVYASYEGSSPTSGSTCRSFDRSALTDDQRAELENLTLVPLTTACNFADGYDYYELTIIDSNGSQAVYRTTGCSYLNLPAAQAMLPPTFSPSVFASGGAGCLN